MHPNDMEPQNDSQSLKALWETHSRRVLNLAYRILQDRDEAEDILMDVFAGLPAHLLQFRGDANLSTWLFRLTTNACLMKIRSEKRRGELRAERHPDICENTLGTGVLENAPLDTRELERALSTLDAETRSLLWLKDAEGLEIKELCSLFNAPEGTLKSRLSRARANLRAHLQLEASYERT